MDQDQVQLNGQGRSAGRPPPARGRGGRHRQHKHTLHRTKKCTLVPAHELNFIYQPSLSDLVYLIAGFK